MASSQAQVLFLSFFIIFSFINRTTSVIVCPDKCSRNTPVVRFPFRLNTQPGRCGYPGFDVSCTNITKTTIQLPKSGQFVVESIDYVSQTLIINDPDGCLPRRFLDLTFNLDGSPYDDQGFLEFTFLNCSSCDQIPPVTGLKTVDCLSGANFTVVAMPTYRYIEINTVCSQIKTVSIPVLWGALPNLAEGVTLRWNVLDCSSCEDRGGFCGFKNFSGPDMELGCANLPSLDIPRSAKNDIILGIAIPGILWISVLGCYLCGRFRACYQSQEADIEFRTSSTPQPAVVLTGGLGNPTIESYPKTVIGDSGRLLNPNDNTCSICLSEYQPKETLRIVPQCNHYYHADCVDDWLITKASCPLCRNSRESSAIVTPYSSTSASSSSSSSMAAP